MGRLNVPPLTALRVGESALLVECGSAGRVQAVYDAARGLLDDGRARDVVPAATTVLLDGVAEPAALAEAVATWSLPEATGPTGELVELVVTYDGPDLDDVARAWDCSREDVATVHAGIEHVVAFCGFAPGFAYCRGLPEQLSVPRLPSPRSRVPAGSLAVADSWTAVYPTDSPGGWRLIGTAAVGTVGRLWDPGADPPALLVPGTRVRFRAG